MEYEKKKKQILGNVEYTNLLSFALVQNKLQRNFKSLVQALLLSQTEGQQTKEDLQNLANLTNKEFGVMRDKINGLQKKIGDLAKNQQSRSLKQSMKKIQQDDSILDKNQKKSEACISSPVLNINYVEEAATQQSIPQSPFDAQKQNKINRDLQNNLSDLKDRLNELFQEQIDRNQLDKKLNSMKDNINLLKAEMKAVADRQSKKASSKRVSLLAVQKVDVQPETSQKNVSGGSGQISHHSVKDDKTAFIINDLQQNLQKQINTLHIQINTMKLQIQQLKQSNNDVKRKQGKAHILIEQLTKNLKKLDEKVNDNNQSFQKELKDIKNQLLNIQTQQQNQQPLSQNDLNSSKKSKPVIESGPKQISPNYNNQINDRISKLQAAIQGLVTEAEFKRFKTQVKDKIGTLQKEDENIKKELKEEVQMLTEILDSKQEQIRQIVKQIQQIKSKLGDINSQSERRNNIVISRCDELKKNLQNLKEDLQFYKSMNENSGQAKGIVMPTMTGESSDDQKKVKEDSLGGKSTQELKKYVNRKLHDQRTYLLGLIRDLEKKSNNKGSNEQDLVNVWDKLAQINLFLNKKANEDDIKKNLAYLEKKLASLYQRITSSDENNQDARIAKTNWFCLSCDKNLQSYQGKVGQHVVWDSMPLKAGYTKYYNKQEKKSLPTLKR